MNFYKKYKFDPVEAKNGCVEWIRSWFATNGPNCKAIIGISGGVDSSVVAALCVEALGRDRVHGVLMPNKVQDDLQDAKDLADFLKITYEIINIGPAYDALLSSIEKAPICTYNGNTRKIQITDQTKINLAPRIRMSTLYGVSQSENGRVANTCNASEDYIGYSTRYGDSAGDFSPLTFFVKRYVKEMGRLILPDRFVDKIPADGLCGKTDEDNFGFPYEILDDYILTGKCEDKIVKAKIDCLHEKNLFKLKPIPFYNPTVA